MKCPHCHGDIVRWAGAPPAFAAVVWCESCGCPIEIGPDLVAKLKALNAKAVTIEGYQEPDE